MSQVCIAEARKSYYSSYDMMMRFVEICPEDIWAKRFGGWPTWQHLYHALASLDFFIMQENAMPVAGLYPVDIASLQSVAE